MRVKFFTDILGGFTKEAAKLVLQVNPMSLCLVLFHKGQMQRAQHLMLHESNTETLSEKIGLFLRGEKKCEVLLVLKRAEILQKELCVNGTENERLELKISKLLPYASGEMAYGIAPWNYASGKSLLYAAPEKRMRELLNQLEACGVKPDEIVSEDQCLWWGYQSRLEGTALMLDTAEERILVVAGGRNGIQFTRQYEWTGETIQNIYAEMSLALMESGVRPEKIYFSGLREENKVFENCFQLPAFYMQEAAVEETIPFPLRGAAHWGKTAAVSLLPHEFKIKSWQASKKNVVFEIGIAGLIFLFMCAVFFAAYCAGLEGRIQKLKNEISQLLPQTASVNEMASGLQRLRESEGSKRRLLALLRQIAETVPLSIRFKNFEVIENEIIFEGESPNHPFLLQTVHAFEKMPDLKEVKLGHTRLRKRLNQDIYEFEITARWRNP